MTNPFLFNCSYFSLHLTLSTSTALSGVQSISGETRWYINKTLEIPFIFVRLSTHRNDKNYDIFTARGCYFTKKTLWPITVCVNVIYISTFIWKCVCHSQSSLNKSLYVCNGTRETATMGIIFLMCYCKNFYFVCSLFKRIE